MEQLYPRHPGADCVFSHRAPAGVQDARPRLEGVNPGRTWLVYTLIRLGIFAVVLTVLLLVGITPWIAAVLAAVIALCISIIALRRPRDEASRSLHDARASRGRASRDTEAPRSDDELAEDDAIESARATEPADDSPAEPAQNPNDNPSPTP
ncbi:hypothetical protein GCM10009851_33590 [Herbiconiux moechotypicola]|uniref:DUF4229 domain-containing protein n=1 Tax=Herbiconiux moechotypicola TaxID=637393 RepID=A0ABN3DZY2_9MICO